MLAAQINFALNILLKNNGMFDFALVSPLSILMTLDLVLFGARNNSASDIKYVIGKGINFLIKIIFRNVILGIKNVDNIHQYFSNFSHSPSNITNGLKVANNILMESSIEFGTTYKSEILKYYDKMVYTSVDFSTNDFDSIEVML